MATEHEPRPETSAYLEKNKAIIAEISSKNVQLVCGEVVGASTRMVFHSAGVLESEVLGKSLFLGVKQRTPDFPDPSGILTRERVVGELATISAIADKFPELSASLPAFYGMLLGTGDTVAIITEDFSEGGLHRVREGGFSPYKVRDLFVDGSVNDDNIQRSAFTVNGKTRLGDFWIFWDYAHREENLQKVGADRVVKNLADFTLETNLKFD